ncbi:DUF2087 domain-containing protein [Caldisalinibacter kiritimatiensis]|uniref:Transcriptional regulator n=1 Tax=Caldisalinibacter kiritimatiensis TaxID=1304284 RepID=R1ATF7_9FIRM|nr:DUF2087 domain-containing protein [Caldisalinibacter kiritimatiensis]EOD00403.1 Transcriptional regulator [Caldisalinibacter kiritimatiensis]
MKNIDELFWNATVEEIKRGYIYDNSAEEYICLICGEKFIKGIIYPYNNYFCDAEKAVKNHIKEKHGSTFNYLINMNKKYTGLTDTQKEILKYFYEGLSDKEIVKAQGGGSSSTVRSHRFKLKEKEKQAKVFLAIMGLLNSSKKERNQKGQEFINIHKGATMVDERYAITEKEREKILKNYFKNGKLSNLPRKEKRKIIVFQYIIKQFDSNKKYTEKEVNHILKKIYDDYVTIRRYLIEYGFMERSDDCSQYWVKL